MAFAALGTLSYTAADNTVTFDALTKSKVRGRAVPTADKRSVAYVEWMIEVEGWVRAAAVDADSTDATLTTIRNTLTQPGGKLAFVNRGFGDLSCNIGNQAACDWGPWPEVLDWMPIGSAQTAFVQWRIAVRIPQGGFQTLFNHLMEVAYDVDTTIDIDGYTELRINGHCTIAMTRIGWNNPGLPDNMDLYRKQIRPAVIPGFQRVHQHFSNSPDRRTLRFTFVDRELPAALPTLVTQAPMRHRVSSDLGKGFNNWSGSISGTITLAAGVPKAFAWNKFLLIVSSRLGFGRTGANGGKKPSGFLTATAKRKGITLLSGIEIEDEIFGRGSHFSVNYRCIGTSFTDILQATNMWQPIQGTDFATWAGSLKNLAFSERGSAKIGQDRNSDRLVDLVQFQEPPIVSFGRVNVEEAADIGANVGGNEPVDKQDSWIFWECKLVTAEDDRSVTHKPLGPQQTVITSPPDARGTFDKISQAIGGLLFGAVSGVPDILQVVGTPTYDVFLVGRASRFNFPIEIPIIKSFGGVPFRIAERKVQQFDMGAVGGIPVKGASWLIRYRLQRAPTQPVALPANPMLQLSGKP